MIIELFLLFLFFLVVFQVKNTLTLFTRIHFLQNEPYGFYDALPSYNRMVCLHWNKWTKAQWRRYVVKKDITGVKK